MAPYALDSRRHCLMYLLAFRPTQPGALGKAAAIKRPGTHAGTAPICLVFLGKTIPAEKGDWYGLLSSNPTLMRVAPPARIFRNVGSFSSTYHSLVNYLRNSPGRDAEGNLWISSVLEPPGSNNNNETQKDPRTYLSNMKSPLGRKKLRRSVTMTGFH